MQRRYGQDESENFQYEPLDEVFAGRQQPAYEQMVVFPMSLYFVFRQWKPTGTMLLSVS